MISERAYRERLDADLARWQADGVVPPAVGDAIRAALPPVPAGVGVATVVAIVGGLLIAAAFLAFIAANWTEIPRPARFGILLGGIVAAYGLGGVFARTGRPLLADLSAAVGSIIFGAAIALTGQMYHLADDFAAGLLLWAAGALTAAILTSSHGALAVALAAAAIWDGARVFEAPASPHLTFWPFWLVAAVLAVAWEARVARHLAALSAIGWWIAAGLGTLDLRGVEDPGLAIAAGGILTAGTGLLIAAGPFAAQSPRALRAMGATLSLYGAFALGLALPAMVMAGVVHGPGHEVDLPGWIVVLAAAGTVLALVAAAAARSAGPALIGLACGLSLVIVAGLAPETGSQPFPAYALSLIAALCLVVSGLVEDVRPRTVAGWMAVAGLIAAITWAVEGSLLARSLFLGAAGAVAVALALLLGRLTPREERA